MFPRLLKVGILFNTFKGVCIEFISSFTFETPLLKEREGAEFLKFSPKEGRSREFPDWSGW